MTRRSQESQLAESRASLWRLTAAPLVWAAHFLFVYAAAAVWCAKSDSPDDSLPALRAIVGVVGAVALAALAIVGRRGWSDHRFGDATLPHDFDSPADRHRFLGFATVLLAGLAGVAVLYETSAVLLLGSCR